MMFMVFAVLWWCGWIFVAFGVWIWLVGCLVGVCVGLRVGCARLLWLVVGDFG